MTNITAFWTTLQNQHSVHAEARKAQLLTMASPREVCGMRWEYIDRVAPHVIYVGREWQFLAGGVAE